MRRLNVLVLHNLDNLGVARRSASDYVLSLPRHAPQHNYLVHRISLPVSSVIRRTNWDLVLMDSTSVGICTYRPRELFDAERARWAFLAESSAVKIVLPQDDANHGRLMDDWFSAIRVDGLFTVRPEFVDLIYPKTSQSAEVHHVYSGYLEDNQILDFGRMARPYRSREIDIGQRVTMYPPRGGRQGRLKGLAADAVRIAACKRGLKVDISTRPEDTLLGDAWYEFLGNCRHTVGAEGGLSVWDPYGEIFDRIESHLSLNPKATFEDVEAACFAGLDEVHVFAGFSPRILEAAVCGCDQILVRGKFAGLLEPETHYLPLDRDLSNIEAILDMLSDDHAAARRIAACQETLVENPKLRFSALVAQILDFAQKSGADRPHVEIPASRFEKLKKNHWKEVNAALARDAERQGFNQAEVKERVRTLLNGQIAESWIGRTSPQTKAGLLIRLRHRWIGGRI